MSRKPSDFYFPRHVQFLSWANVRTDSLSDINANWNAWRRSDSLDAGMIPDPDYSDSDSEVGADSYSGSDSGAERLRELGEEDEDWEEGRRRRPHVSRSNVDGGDRSVSNDNIRCPQSLSADSLLIKPKKPSHHNSTERQRFHKELQFSQKYGKRRVNPKTELQVALENYTEKKTKKHLAATSQTSLEKVLEKQSKKIEMYEREGSRQPSWIERLQSQHIARLADPKTDEFYRVHARVVSHVVQLSEGDSSESSSQSSRSRESSPDSED